MNTNADQIRTATRAFRRMTAAIIHTSEAQKQIALEFAAYWAVAAELKLHGTNDERAEYLADQIIRRLKRDGFVIEREPAA